MLVLVHLSLHTDSGGLYGLMQIFYSSQSAFISAICFYPRYARIT